ncbi:hypothetical protein FNV43_RR25173 [Rhamnella rubrinervis]|uniref:Uncharacterized protein n=1 Tax=Rhamnella rubrinervis TaxID=2594499 RepID=A0A8K0DUK3_9ROSA|nr:hypothetical protein FNV43_RR25173 [Rhamnella rubrinervis]
MFSIGNIQVLLINDPVVIKELRMCTSLNFGRPTFQKKVFDSLSGDGVSNSNGALWSQQRKIIAPEFFNKKVKGMTKMIVDSATIVVNLLATQIEREGGVADINVEYHTVKFGRSVISRLCFGSNHSLGEEIFSKFRVLVDITSTKAGTINAIFPILRFEILLPKDIKKNKRTVGTEKDILQLIIEGAKNKGLNQAAADRFVTDNCRVRAEVLEVFQGQVLPDDDMLQKMKVLTMVIYESMRLYPPGPFLAKEALGDFRFGGIYVPKGLGVLSSSLTMHYDPEIWGPDAHTFNPERFSNGPLSSCEDDFRA